MRMRISPRREGGGGVGQLKMCQLVKYVALYRQEGCFIFEYTRKAAAGDWRPVNGFKLSRSLKAYRHRDLNEE